MNIRRYRERDLEAVLRLFYDTVHAVCGKDYTKEQLHAWADGNPNRSEWKESLLKNHTLVAERNGMIIGFADLENGAYLNRLYVHKDVQGRGIGTALCDALERAANDGEITVHASATAKPFFEGRGYTVEKEQTVVRHGVRLNNFIMKKTKF